MKKLDEALTSDILTKEQILSATEETLRRFGVAKTSITDVAKLLNVSHGTIYRHFKSKKEIFEAATEMWLNDRILKPLTDVYGDTTLTGSQHMKAYIKKLCELKRYYSHKDEELFTMYAKVTNESSDIISKHIKAILEQLSKIIERDINSNSPEELAKSIFYATERFHHPAHSYEWKTDTIESEFENVWNLLENGF